MRVIGIDPGPKESGLVCLIDGSVVSAATLPNLEIRYFLAAQPASATIGIEQVRSYGMAVGAEVFDTCVETGRFVQVVAGNVILIPRMDVKMHLCRSPRAKDANVRQALIDRLGPAGTKKAPGPTYGVSKHAWAALAVAVTVMDRLVSEDRAALS